MKKFGISLLVGLVVCALAGTAALAKVKSKTITVGMDFIVGNTLVKKGTYKWNFDTETNELTIVAKDNSVAAKTNARLEKREKSASGTDIVFAQRGGNQALVSLAFHGDMQNIVVASSGAEMAGSQ